MILKDKNGTTVSSFKIVEDGIVYGYIGQPGQGYTTVSLDSESCSVLGFSYNVNCYWSSNINQTTFGTRLDSENTLNLNIENSNVDEIEMFFDYVIELDTRQLTSTSDLGTKLSKLRIDMNLFSKGTSLSLLSENLFNGANLETHLNDGGIGLYTIFGSYTQSQVVNFIQNSAGFSIQPSKLLEGWNESKQILKSKTNNSYLSLQFHYLQIGVIATNYFDGINVKISNFRVKGRNFTTNNVISRVEKNPSFEFEKIVDNKKVWRDITVDRTYENNDYSTSYKVDDERLVLNNKEIDLSFTPSNIPLYRLWDKVLNDRTFLNTRKYNFTPEGLDVSFLISDLNNTDIDTIDEFRKVLKERFTNPRTVRIQHKNNLLKLMYYYSLYKALFVDSYFSSMMESVSKIDEYWLDLIDEFIPSTSIWDGVIKISNNDFNENVFPYKSYALTNVLTSNTNTQTTVDIVYYGSMDDSSDTSFAPGKRPELNVNNVKVSVNNVSYGCIQDSPLKITSSNE